MVSERKDEGRLSSDWKHKAHRAGPDVRWDAGPRQHFGLHGVEALALADAQLDLDSVVGVVLEEEAVVNDELGVGSCAIEDVDL